MTFDSRMPWGDLPGWTQIWTETFNTPCALGQFQTDPYYSTKFRCYGPSTPPGYKNWQDSSLHGRYMPEIISVEDGIMTEHIHSENNLPYVAAVVPKIPGTNKAGQLYGRYSIKLRADKLQWYKIVPLLWPDSSKYKIDGEIDFPEMNLWTTTLKGFVHKTDQDLTKPTQQGSYTLENHDMSIYHVYSIEWMYDIVVFILDGNIVQTFIDRIPHVPMHWVWQTETALGAGMKRPDPLTKGKVQIAWAAAWAYTP